MIALNGQTFEHIRKAVIRYDGTVLRGRRKCLCQKDESIMDNPKLPAVKIKPKIAAPWDLPVRIEPS